MILRSGSREDTLERALKGNVDLAPVSAAASPQRQDVVMTLWRTDDDEVAARLNSDLLALLLGRMPAQQIPMEKAFEGPYVLLRQWLRADLDARLGAGRKDSVRPPGWDVTGPELMLQVCPFTPVADTGAKAATA